MKNSNNIDGNELPEDKKEWTFETVFRAENTGKALLEFFLTLKGKGKEIEGKHFEMKPAEVIRVTLKDLLPKEIVNEKQLVGLTTSLDVKNIDSDLNGKYEMTIEGPFRKELTVAEKALQPIAQKIINEYQNAVYKGSASDRRELVKNPIPEEYKIRNDLYTGLCHFRGKMFASLFMIDEADGIFEEGWQNYSDDNRWFYAIDWAYALMVSAGMQLPKEEKNIKINKAIEKLDLVKKWSYYSIYQKYNDIAVDGMKAYCLCFQSRHDEAKSILKNIEYIPIATADYVTGDINTFFDYYGFAIAAAIELRDAELIKYICKVIGSDKKDILIQENAWRCLKMTIGYVRQTGRTQLKNLFDIIKEGSPNYYPELQNLAAFLKLMQRNEESNMEKYFK